MSVVSIQLMDSPPLENIHKSMLDILLNNMLKQELIQVFFSSMCFVVEQTR